MSRINPKDINKLQLEGLVKAGAFDTLSSNRQSLFNSIPGFITKSKNIYENKSANQIDLFGESENQDDEVILDTQDWKFEERLSKEFEAIGFYMSDHPLNQFKEIFKDYNIIDYNTFNNDTNLTEANIASTLLKIQERKTAKGNSYAVLKMTDLTSVFELFIFSDILTLNREILKEGNSLILTLTKSISNDDNRFKRINVQKLASLKNLFNSPISSIVFKIKSDNQLKEISQILNEKGNTKVSIEFEKDKDTLFFELENPRKVDRKSVNLLRNNQILSIIR